MAYAIEPKSTKDFINMETNLPRFQRKQTWKPIENFKLCISVFKNYPIGVVIINKNGEGNWLLDGRQRLNALTQISTNPIEVYIWAMKFIKFKASSEPGEIKELYWDKINEYLQRDFEENVYSEDSVGIQSPVDEIDEEENDPLNFHSFDPSEQKKGLNDLLNLILMVHSIKAGKSSWERNFDFSSITKRKLPYYKIEQGHQVFAPELLVKTMEEILGTEKDKKSKEIVTKETFIEYFIDQRYCFDDDKEKNKFKQLVDQKWDDIESCFNTIYKVKKILEDSRIGIIEITAASDLDAQNIFSLVNDGGTQLTAEELLSAKPYWNVKVERASEDVKKCTKGLYDKLKIVQPDDIVRWDLCATFISRIDKNGLIFDKKNDKAFAEQTTLGFKLFSALYMSGISSANVSEIEKKDPINWETDFEPIVTDLNNLCDLIGDHDYFKCMKSWGQSVMSLTSNTIALEFITILYRSWSSTGKQVVDCSETRNLKRNAIALLDKLIYEYSTRQWRGSSDSKLAKDLEKIPERFIAKPKSDWTALLEDMAKGLVNDQVVTQKLIKPILFHAKHLSEEYPSVTDANVNYDLDHIYPQTIFKGNTNVNPNYKDSLCNLEILSSKANTAKNDKRLEEIFDESIKNEISKSSGLPIDSFKKYSDIKNIDDMLSERLTIIKKSYEDDRDSMLMN